MKKYTGILVLFFLSISGINAQYFDGGIVAGFSASQVDGDELSGFNKLGLVGGGWVSRTFSDNLSGQLELRYIGKGAYESNNTPPNEIFYKLALHYIDLPVLINFHYRDNVVFNLGVSPEYLIKHLAENQFGIDPDDSLPYNSFTMSAIIGCGYTFLEKLTFNVRYNYSIIPMSPHASHQTYLFNRGKYNNVLTIALYYQISLQ